MCWVTMSCMAPGAGRLGASHPYAIGSSRSPDIHLRSLSISGRRWAYPVVSMMIVLFHGMVLASTPTAS